MRSGSDAKGILPSPAQPLLTFAKLLFEKVMTTMAFFKVPRSALLEKLARREQAVRHHLLTLAKLLFEKVITTMNTLIKVPRSALLKKLERREQAARHHLNTEEMAAFVSRSVSRGARKLAINHMAACEGCRKMVANIADSETHVKDINEPST